MQKFTYVAVCLYSLACAVLFGSWLWLVQVPPSANIAQLISHIQNTLALLVGHIVTVLSTGTDKASPGDQASPQAGFCRVGVMAILAALAACLLVGCAGVQQVVSGYQASAIRGIRAAEDNNIALWTANACGTPFSAAIRNPALIPALKALCLPVGDSTNPAVLFDSVPK